MIKVTVKNLRSVSSRFNSLPDTIDSQIQTAIGRAGYAVERESKKSITELKAVRTGRLRASISTALSGIGKSSRATISPHTNYAIFVHEGMGTNRYKGPRQFMFIGLNKAQPTIERLLRDAKSSIERKFSS